MMDLFDELAGLVQALETARIPYALCGGLAVSIHGFTRATEDIDIVTLPGHVEEIVRVAGDLGFTLDSGVIPLPAVDLEMRRIVKVVGDIALPLDIFEVPETGGIWASRVEVLFAGSRLSLLGRDGLIEMKRHSTRSKDKLDIDELRKLNDQG